MFISLSSRVSLPMLRILSWLFFALKAKHLQRTTTSCTAVHSTRRDSLNIVWSIIYTLLRPRKVTGMTCQGEHDSFDEFTDTSCLVIRNKRNFQIEQPVLFEFRTSEVFTKHCLVKFKLHATRDVHVSVLVKSGLWLAPNSNLFKI